MRPNQRPPIAVVGVSALFPGSLGAGGFWRDILAGTDRITDVPASHWLLEDYYDPDPAAPDKTYARRGAFLRDVDFDALGWGVPPSIIPATDTSQLLALIVAQQVLADAARARDIDRSRMSIILGITSAQELLGTMVSRLQRPIWQKSLREAGVPEDEVKDICERIASHYVPWQESSFPGVLGNVVAGRIANRLDLGGTNCVTDAACASTFSALSMAVNELYLGDSDVVIAGGVDTMNDIFMYMCFSKTPALSASGDCRPFSDQADGTMLGEGLGMLALKRLADAERDDDHVYAVIRSVGSSSDGRAKSVYAPRSSGQASAIRRAYDRAGISPSTVELVEAHGTGTKAGDAAEFGGLKMAFDEAGRTDRQWCALGSVKSQIGHTKSSAGAAGLIKAILAVHGKALPPTIKVDRPNPKLDIEQTPFYLNTEARPWVRGPDHPRRAGVSSFGFGGSNFHVVVEEYQGLADIAPRMRACSHELVVLSGDDIVAQAREHATLAEAEGYLAWLSHHTLHRLDATASRRLAVVATDDADLAKKLRAAADRIASAPDAAFDTPDGTHYGTGAAAGPVALLFPGQGSQYVSMGGAAAIAFEPSIAAWDAAAPLGLHGVVFPPPVFTDEDRAAQSATLTETQWAQPAIGAASLATLKLLSRTGIDPIALGGHSYGEVTALHAGGVLSEADLLSVAQKRGALMAEAAKLPGAMLAVTATIEDVRAFVAQSSLELVVANHNHPTQVVLSGAVDQIDAALAALPAAGLRGKRLSVATAFHSPIVSPSAEPFAAWLEDIDAQPPLVPVYANATAAPYPTDAAEIRAQLAGQIASPVRFVEMIEAMHDAGARVFVEVGPGSVLTGLVSRILKKRPHHAVATDRKNARDLRPLLSAFGKLFAAGVPMSAAALWADYAVPDNPHTRTKPRVAIPLNGSNYGKPYPPPGGVADLPPPNPPRPTPEPEIVRVEVPVEVRVEVPVPVAAPPSVTPEQTPMSDEPKNRPALATTHQPVAPSTAWIEAWQAAQQHTAEAHSAYQRAMADAHTAFLKTAETSFMGLSAMASGGVHTPAPAPAPAQTWQQPVAAPAPAPVPTQTWQPPAPAPVAAAPAPSFITETPVSAPAPVAATPAPSLIAETPVAATPAAPTADLHGLLLDVVAEKTGYPAEMLTMDMQLEGDLGIDSIKRVEILSAMQEKEPSLPEVDASAMASLQTLGQIADYMGAQLGSPVVETTPITAAAPTADLHGLLLGVVAEKTGYPAEMLTMDMQLEGDLGIDSIKRVEILSAMQEQEPSLPEVDASAMASLQTLGQIVEYMGAQIGSPVTETPITTAAPTADLHSLLLGVVAEKTGYPAEMLTMDMQLEGDLGIDSIKRVEILSAMQEQEPSLPEVDASAMASLQTLGQIVEYMGAQIGSPVVEAPIAAAPAAPSTDLHGLLLGVVAEKTGYPAEMLTMDMQLEGDLGIDSIKRVEILSSMQEKDSSLPEVDASAMASLQTLGQIVEYMGAQLGSPVVETPVGGLGVDLKALLLGVVAEKTGYPAEMLTMDMQLEGDLGIDSIKRVEILSSMQEQEPSLPEVDASAMASLQTLGQIVEYMGDSGGNDLAPTPSAGASVRADSEPVRALGVGRYGIEVVDAPALGMSQPGLQDGQRVVITSDGAGVAEELVLALGRRGIAARVVASVPEEAEAVLFLGGLRPLVDASVNQEAFLAARAVAGRFTASGGMFVTVQDTGGAFGLTDFPAERAWSAGLAALARTAAQEWPAASVKAIDLQRGERSAAVLAEAIVAELLSGGPELEVGLTAGGRRQTLRDVQTLPPTGESLLGAEDVVVVSGGARGVTAASVVALAAASGARFVLLGRTAIKPEPACVVGITDDAALKRALMMEAKATGQRITPADLGRQVRQLSAVREIQATLAAVSAAGGQAQYISVDVTDEDGIASALSEVRSAWGPITGIIHGAGVIADKRIADKPPSDFDWVFNTKVGGLQALLRATEGDPLRALVMFSSVAARCGNVGQSDYAMANEVLNKVAESVSRSRPGCRVRSLGWGPWEGGMVSPQLKARFEQLGVTLIPLDAGAQLLVDDLLSGDDGRVELTLGGAPRPEALLADGAIPETALDLHIDRKSHPYLAAHAIDGVPVVPVVLAVEWFSRAARAMYPTLHLVDISDVRVLRGIRLSSYLTGGDLLRLRCEQVSNGDGVVVRFSLRGADGQLHYTATGRLHPLPPPPRGGVSPGPVVGSFNKGVYTEDGVLFHGPDFQVIDTVEGVSDEGISASMRGVEASGWPAEQWRTDAAAFDGGLQLALLWSERVLGGASLPTGIGRIRTWADTPDGPFRCVLTGSRSARGGKATSDLVFFDRHGELFAELSGVETHLLPNRTPRA